MAARRHALAFHHHEKNGWWYIPTEPDGRAWRGPYISRAELERYCFRELGEHCTIAWTTIAPKFLRPSHVLGGFDDSPRSVVDFKQAKEQRELERRKLDP
jgi:hypothetical protein